LTQQTKDEAREETLRRWHALPPEDRQTLEQAQIFAAALAAELHFHTMSNTRKVILSWLVRDLDGLPAWGNVPPESVVAQRHATDAAAEEAVSAEAPAASDEEDSFPEPVVAELGEPDSGDSVNAAPEQGAEGDDYNDDEPQRHAAE
jgi:hypothetical protein